MLFRLPFMGKWKVSQGYNGKLTHQADWRFAWDFIKVGADGKTYQGNGFNLSDYFCYSLPVYPAADGVVDSVSDGIPDNEPGDANVRQNWGNTVILKHADGLYSKYSHLKPGSIRLKQGDSAVASRELALVGNSGRSPEPHLHFQIQAEPDIDAATIEYPFGYFLRYNNGTPSLIAYSGPNENDLVCNLNADQLLRRTLHFIPGQKIRVDYLESPDGKLMQSEWEVHTDYFNNSYFFDRQSNSTAWFVSDDQQFYFTYYEGPKDNQLFTFFSACFRVPLMFDKELIITDQLPLSVITGSWLRWLQDWMAPFYLFLHYAFALEFLNTDDTLDPSVYMLKTSTKQSVFHKNIQETEFQVEINRGGKIRINSSGKSLCLTTIK